MTSLKDTHESFGKGKWKPSGNSLAGGSEKVVAHVRLLLFQTCFRKPPQQILPCK